MDPRFADIYNKPDNEIFNIVFFPDRIYHAEYLNGTVSQRYRYNVTEVRNKHDITFMKAQVYMDGQFLANVFRIEYQGTRLIETARQKGRMLQDGVICNLSLTLPNGQTVNATFRLTFCNWVRVFQVELWDNLEPVAGASHHFKVLAQMGLNGAITHIPALDAALQNPDNVKVVNLSFREDYKDEPFGYQISSDSATSDCDYFRTYQAPNNPQPSSPDNTVHVNTYMVDFQRGWFLNSANVVPVRYSNAMMENINPAYDPNGHNIVEMRWILQREMGGNIVYFHQVTVTPGSFEGVHQHIGSEELYYIVSGEGIAYMGEGDDPASSNVYPLVQQEIYCIGTKPVRQLPVKPGNVIYTKSGGIHGIRNPSTTTDLVFVAFGYQCS